MTTLNEMIEIVKAENPSLKTGSEELGYVELNDDDYNATIESWANARLEQEAKDLELAQAKEAKDAAIAKLSALGLDLDDLKSLGF